MPASVRHLATKLGVSIINLNFTSLPGLDLNHCSQHMLERISGLSKARAKAILAWREDNGSFTNREQVPLSSHFRRKLNSV